MPTGGCLYFPLPHSFEKLKNRHTFESEGEEIFAWNGVSLSSFVMWLIFSGAGYVRTVLPDIILH